MPKDKEQEDSFSLIDAVGDVFGGVAGVSVGILHQDAAGFFAGALFGSGVAHAFRYGAHLLANRFLTQREKARVGLVIALAAREINSRLEAGEQPRSDGFFESGVNNRSDGDEIAEAVLIAAQREHEERKLPYIAKLLAFIAFTPGIDAPMANQMVKVASSLSYRQFRILALANHPIRSTLSTPMFYGSTGQAAATLMALLNEMFELYRDRLVDFPGTIAQMSRAPTDPRSMPLQNLQLGEHGQYLHLGMGLGEMPESEFVDLIEWLTTPPSTHVW